jgi:divalent metal cation (Fe/Co/Zn/Cd) transporter
MLHVIEFIATMSAAIFAGAALYINLVEHPARMLLDTKSAALEWAPSYRRATWMQAPLALVSLVAGLASWWLGGHVGWAIAALLIGAVIPFTFLGIMPTNRRLLAPGRDLATTETRELLEKWVKLHGVRTALSLLATAVYVWEPLRS